MKAMLLSLFLFLSFVTFSQNSKIYNDEWYSSIEEPINFIIYKRSCETTVQFRVYRGDEDFYKISIFRENKIVYQAELKQIDEFDVYNFYPGAYIIKAEDSKGNSITKELIIGT